MIEIFDGIDRFSRIVHLRDEMRQLREKIETFRCGGCRFWMCKNRCPREQKRIVNNEERICDIFVEKEWYVELRAEWQARLDEIKGQLKALGVKP